MTLPDFTNQYSISDFNTAARCPDAKSIFRLTLKRRYMVGSVPTYDADWTTISSYIIDDGLGNIVAGVDDQDWLQGVTRTGDVDLIFNNIDRKFNDNTDVESLWYDAATDFYIAGSRVCLEYGFELPTGTQLYATDPFLDGVIRGDSLKYDINNHTFLLTVMSRLEYLKSLTLNDIITVKRLNGGSATGLTDAIFNYAVTNSGLSLTLLANNCRNDIFYQDINAIDTNCYNFVENVAQQTGGLFGITRSGGLYLTYLNNPYYQDTTTTFATAGAIAYYNFDTSLTVATDAIIDYSGNGYHLSYTAYETTAAFPSTTTGKFGSGNYFSVQYDGQTFATYYYQRLAANLNSGGNMTSEMLIKWHRQGSYAYPSANNAVSYLKITQGTTTFTTFLQRVGTDKDGYFSLRSIPTLTSNAGRFSLGEDQWYYLAFVNDNTNNLYRVYANGNEIVTLNTSTSVFNSSAIALLAMEFCEYEIDTWKISDAVLTQEDIKNNTARVFGNKFQWSSSSAYTFTNYGADKNIFSIDSYDSGYKKLYNKVVIPIDAQNEQPVYRANFTWDTTAVVNFNFRLRIGTELYGTVAFSGTTNAAFANYVNETYPKVNISYTGNNWTFDLNNITEEENRTSWFWFLNASPTYTAADNRSIWPYCSFSRVNPQTSYVYTATLSTYKYGTREYVLDEIQGYSGDRNNYAIMAGNILANYQHPRIRMSMRTNFLEGDVDLFTRVTVNLQNDIRDGFSIYDIDNWGEGRAESYTGEGVAGHITWSSKDFWVVGYEHDYKNQSTIYSLIEILSTDSEEEDDDVQVGTILAYAGASAPDGYLLCYGQAVSRASYATLYGVLGTVYGVGDGSTTFNIPDLRGRIAVGKDNMGGTGADRITGAWADSIGGAGGAETHTLTTAEMPAHTHGLRDHYPQNIEFTSGSGNFTNATGAVSNSEDTDSVGSGGAHNNIQPSFAINYIIKY